MFRWESFWSLPCSLIEDVATKLTEQVKQRANRESLTTAYLTDLVRQIARSTDDDYQPDANRYLPFPPPDEDEELDEVDTPSLETLRILFAGIKAGKVPNGVVAHLSPLLPGWQKLIK